MAKTCLKVLKVNCSRLRKSLSLEVFACLEVWPLDHDGSVLLSVVAQALLYNFLCACFSSSLFRLSRWRLSVESPDFLVLDSVLEPVVGVELPNEVFISSVRWMSLIVEWNTSANMFYLLKNLLLLIMVIFKLKCNNLIFNENMILNASYVCLHAFLLRRESPDPDPGRRTPHFWGGSVTSVKSWRGQELILDNGKWNVPALASVEVTASRLQKQIVQMTVNHTHKSCNKTE
jgi:hypothetical protein